MESVRGRGRGSFYMHGDSGRYVDSIIKEYLLLKNVWSLGVSQRSGCR